MAMHCPTLMIQHNQLQDGFIQFEGGRGGRERERGGGGEIKWTWWEGCEVVRL